MTNKVIYILSALAISTSAIADQKKPITPSLPPHVGTDITGKEVIHNAPAQAETPAEIDDNHAQGSNKRKKNKHSR